MKENRALFKVSLKESFHKWLELTKTFNKLTGQEIDIVALFLYNRYMISQSISSDIYINRILFDKDTKAQIRNELDIKPQVFLNILSSLRKKRVLTTDSINKGYIPRIDKNTLRVVFEFKIQEDEGQGN